MDWSLLEVDHQFFDVGKDVDSRPFGVDNLGGKLFGDGSGIGIEVCNPLVDGILRIVEVISKMKFKIKRVQVRAPKVKGLNNFFSLAKFSLFLLYYKAGSPKFI